LKIFSIIVPNYILFFNFKVKEVMTAKDGNPLTLIQLGREPLLSKSILPACLNLNSDFVNLQLQISGFGQAILLQPKLVKTALMK